MKFFVFFLIPVLRCVPVFSASLSLEELPQTVVVRVSNSPHAIAVFHSREFLSGNEESIKKIPVNNFIPVEPNVVTRGELDRDTSRSSWFFSLGLNSSYTLRFGNSAGNYYLPVYSYNNYTYPYYPYYHCHNYFPAHSSYPGYGYPQPPAQNPYGNGNNGGGEQSAPPLPNFPNDNSKNSGPYSYFFYSWNKR
ncbi:MAG: hypothetical protein A4S09_11225 [Proteobacteria bacterium SG_bin7]|nr:MAG: hypothetical protein A4S09_11225 [Proteobacteria bacterium SG_bin7]